MSSSSSSLRASQNLFQWSLQIYLNLLLETSSSLLNTVTCLHLLQHITPFHPLHIRLNITNTSSSTILRLLRHPTLLTSDPSYHSCRLLLRQVILPVPLLPCQSPHFLHPLYPGLLFLLPVSLPVWRPFLLLLYQEPQFLHLVLLLSQESLFHVLPPLYQQLLSHLLLFQEFLLHVLHHLYQEGLSLQHVLLLLYQ